MCAEIGASWFSRLFAVQKYHFRELHFMHKQKNIRPAGMHHSYTLETV